VNAQLMAKTAYGSAATPVRTDRGTEYALFTRITHRMRNAALKGPSGFVELSAALYENSQLWTTLAADVAGADNALPAGLRGQIFYLCEFTTLHTRKVLKKKANVLPLIEINIMMMRGLGIERIEK
jgi:flagellar protein FlaF